MPYSIFADTPINAIQVVAPVNEKSWFSGRALALHSEGPTSNPGHLQVEDPGRRRCERPLPESLESYFPTELTLTLMD